MQPLRELLECALHPEAGFQRRATQAPDNQKAFLAFLAWRTPIALVEVVLAWQLFRGLWLDALDPSGPLWTRILPLLPDLNPAELSAFLHTCPRPPTFAALLPLALLLGALTPPSLWLHHVAWDHASLRLLGGAAPHSIGLTTRAESEALRVGALGAALGLLAFLPGLGCALNLLLVPLGLWFWILRGFALAAFHRCPLWKGITATLLHIVLVVAFYGLAFLVALLVPFLLA